MKFPLLLWNSKVHYRVLKNLPLVLSWASWVQSTSSHAIYFKSILLSSHLCKGIPTNLFLISFPTEISCSFLVTRMRAAWPPNLSFLIWSSWRKLVKSTSESNKWTKFSTQSRTGVNIFYFTAYCVARPWIYKLYSSQWVSGGSEQMIYRDNPAPSSNNVTFLPATMFHNSLKLSHI